MLFPKGLYLILDPTAAGGRALPEIVTEAMAANVRLFQLRMKGRETRAVYETAVSLCSRVRQGGGTFIVNDRCDVALAVDADGVHLGQEDLPLAHARAIMGATKLIGISTNTVIQALEAEAGGADYIGFGPIFPTVSKTNAEPVVGLAGLREARAQVRIPIVAIGGITAANIADVLAAGADAGAVISAVLGASDLAAALAEMMKAIQERT